MKIVHQKTNQSGFRANYSSAHQLIAITCDIFTAFDANPPLAVRVVLLGLPNAHDRVWHNGTLYKHRCNGINGSLLCLLESFLKDRHCIKYARIPVFTDPYSSVYSVLYGRIRVSENPCSHIFYAVRKQRLFFNWNNLRTGVASIDFRFTFVPDLYQRCTLRLTRWR